MLTLWLDAGQNATAVWLPSEADERAPEQEAQVEPPLVDLLGTVAAKPVIALGDALVAARPQEVPHLHLRCSGPTPRTGSWGSGRPRAAQR